LFGGGSDQRQPEYERQNKQEGPLASVEVNHQDLDGVGGGVSRKKLLAHPATQMQSGGGILSRLITNRQSIARIGELVVMCTKFQLLELRHFSSSYWNLAYKSRYLSLNCVSDLVVLI
jgi:hypothetical protein